jgi:hypothetical protein
VIRVFWSWYRRNAIGIALLAVFAMTAISVFAPSSDARSASWRWPICVVGSFGFLGLAVVSGVIGTVHVAIEAVRRRRTAAGLCPGCGYDLRASKDRCPECGLAIMAKKRDES